MSGPASTRTRLLTVRDVPELARLHATNRAFMAPWDAVRGDAFYSEPGQDADLRRLLAEADAGRVLPHGIVDDSGALAGRITLTSIVRGAFQSCSLGYWVADSANGRGYASAAVAEMLGVAFGRLGLHRVEAATLLHNVRSQRVLAKNGFEPFGTAPAYLRIAGEWQEHALFQRLAPAG